MDGGIHLRKEWVGRDRGWTATEPGVSPAMAIIKSKLNNTEEAMQSSSLITSVNLFSACPLEHMSSTRGSYLQSVVKKALELAATETSPSPATCDRSER